MIGQSHKISYTSARRWEMKIIHVYVATTDYVGEAVEDFNEVTAMNPIGKCNIKLLMEDLNSRNAEK